MKLTEGLAVYAALLSTFVFVWNIVRARPRVKVRVVFGIEGGDDKETQMGIYISVQNPSAHAVHLAGLDFLYPYERTSWKDQLSRLVQYRRLPRSVGWVYSSLSNYKIKDGCPLTIEPGQSHGTFVPQSVLEDLLKNAVRRELRIVAQDQLWQSTYSNKIQIDWYDSKAGKNDGA